MKTMKVPKLRFSVSEFISKLTISNSSIWTNEPKTPLTWK